MKPRVWRAHLLFSSPDHTQLLLKEKGPAACHSKANKEARLVEREVCFISEDGSWRGGG